MTSTAASDPLTQAQARALADAVAEHEELALAVSAYEDANGEWVFEATCADEPDLESFSRIARLTLGGDVSFTAEEIDPDIDWVARSQEGLSPVEAGGFFIHGSHDSHRIPAGSQPILIEAAQAFGTGHHETTSGCLEAISEILKVRRPERPLDLGAGTGVLAIALARRLRRKVVASDIDPVAVRITRENAELNGVSRWVRSVESKGLENFRVRSRAPYDLIVANILAAPLVRLAPAIAGAASPGADIVVSGILRPQAARVVTAFREQDVILQRRINRGDWTTLMMRKAGRS